MLITFLPLKRNSPEAEAEEGSDTPDAADDSSKPRVLPRLSAFDSKRPLPPPRATGLGADSKFSASASSAESLTGFPTGLSGTADGGSPSSSPR